LQAARAARVRGLPLQAGVSPSGCCCRQRGCADCHCRRACHPALLQAACVWRPGGGLRQAACHHETRDSLGQGDR
jgi:hypothetical protein